MVTLRVSVTGRSRFQASAGRSDRTEIVADQSQLAEVRFIRYGISIYGMLAKMSRDSVAVRLQTFPARMDVFNPGTDAELVAVTRAGVYVTKTQVASQKSGDLLLSVTAPLKKL